MLLDLFSTDNYASFNKKLAHIIGLDESIYVNQLLNIIVKATKKKKVYDGYINVDRKYIYNQTTLDIESQMKIDSKLNELNILERNFDDPDLIKLDIELLASITSNDDIELINDIKKKMKKDKRLEKEIKEASIIKSMSSAIKCQNQVLYEALVEWIRVIISDKKSFLTKALVQEFEVKLFNYVKGDLNKALEIVNIATLNGYKDIAWSIKKYEQELKDNKKLQQTSTYENLSQKTF